MNIDHWIAVLALAVAVGLLLAYYFYIKTIRTKVLGIAYTNPVPLTFPLKEINVPLGGTCVPERTCPSCDHGQRRYGCAGPGSVPILKLGRETFGG